LSPYSWNPRLRKRFETSVNVPLVKRRLNNPHCSRLIQKLAPFRPIGFSAVSSNFGLSNSVCLGGELPNDHR
jgi:hypothetical protein